MDSSDNVGSKTKKARARARTNLVRNDLRPRRHAVVGGAVGEARGGDAGDLSLLVFLVKVEFVRCCFAFDSNAPRRF
jgi:hypothetical protein